MGSSASRRGTCDEGIAFAVFFSLGYLHEVFLGGDRGVDLDGNGGTLRIDSDAVPAKLIGQRLDALQKDHPQEYEKGFQLTVTPPAPRYPYPYGAYPPGYPGMPAAVPAAPTSISIPGTAASTNAPAAVPAKP